MFYVYVLKSENFDRIYIGMSEDVQRRLKEHNNGKTKSTKGYVPWNLLFYETYYSRVAARAREKELKTGRGRTWIRKNKLAP